MNVPKGWKLVPERLTQDMADAAICTDRRLSVWKYADVYTAMLANAPECAELAASQAEVARLRGALEGMVQAYTDPEESDLDKRLALTDARNALK